jgi:hypothetical protein
MSMALHAPSNDPALQHIEGREQRSRAVALGVARHRAGAAALQGQSGLCAVERLDLALLVNGQDYRGDRRIHVEPDDVADLGGGVRVVGQLEGADTVWLKTVQTPDTLHVGETNARRLGHGAPRPMGRPAGRFGKRESDHPLAHLGPERRDARRACPVAQKALHAFPGEALLPAPDGGLALGLAPRNGSRAEPAGPRQHNRGTPDVLLGAVAICNDGFQPVAAAAVTSTKIPGRTARLA